MPEIEFVDPEPDTGQDEELDTGPRRHVSARTKRIGAGALLAVVAAAVLIGVRQHGDGGPPAAAFPARHSADLPGTPAAVPTSVDATCPFVDACEVFPVLPTAVSDALRDGLPHLTGVTGVSVFVVRPTPVLATRRVTARDGDLAVAVEIHPATRYDHPRSAALDAGRKRLVYARTLTHGLAVTVSVSGPPGQAPGLDVVRSLAADPRLLSTT